jgi:hypothetical protein
MIIFARSRFAVCIGMATALLAGCGGSQPPIGAPGAIPQTAARGHSEAQKGDLLYVTSSTGTYAYVYMFSYPQGKLVGKIAKQITGLCSDSRGNVYMTQSYHSTSTIFEYAHAGKKPIATLSDPYNGAYGCAIDPTTGNLAVANAEGSTIVIYQHARGKPKRYYIWFGPYDVAYDPKGHLYALGGRGTQFALLDNGQFRRVTLDKHVEYSIGAQWDGKYMALGNAGGYSSKGVIRQYTITGHSGVEEGVMPFDQEAEHFYIDGSTIVLSDGGGDKIYFLAYPAGGNPTKTISGIATPGSVTVSVTQ